MKRTLIGTSGWSYDDWVGPFYPKPLARGDWIRFYADHFPTVEVNFTHYRMPNADELASITDRMRRTPLTDVVYKAPRTITHESIPAGLAPAVRTETELFFEALEPVARSGLLRGILFQFDHGTGPDEVLPGVSEALDLGPPAPLFVEVRHALFNEDRYLSALRKLVEDEGGCIVASDSPASTITRAPPAEVAYFRFHGRNRDAWFVPDAGGEHGSARYDYLYTRDELEELAVRVRAAGSAEASETLVYFNNHAAGKAADNALTMMKMLGILPPGKARTLDDF